MNRTVGIVLTIVTVLCCACPGFGLCVAGVMGLAGVPFTTTVNGESTTQPIGAPVAIGLMCLAFFTFRNKPAPATVVSNINEPLPPAS